MLKSQKSSQRRKSIEVSDEHYEMLKAFSDAEKRLLWRVAGDVIELGMKHYIARGGRSYGN